MTTRRDFIKNAALASAGVAIGTSAFSASSYRRILGANDRVRVGIIGFSDRFRSSLAPSFAEHSKELNFEFMGVSDLWNRRRDEAEKFITDKGWAASQFVKARNNEELLGRKDVDAVIISTADFQHALHCAEAVKSGRDVYVEKPFAESLEDARAVMKAVDASKQIVQVGSQRRSAPNYHAAYDYIKSGKFGDITTVEMTWNVNQPGRWRRKELVEQIREQDTDWTRFLMNRPKVAWNPRFYLEYRLFYPYSSGIPGQWMAHQIDTVHWFSGLDAPRNVVANGGVYTWKDGRTNADTFSATFEYGPADDKTKGFQVIYSSRFNNEAGGVKEYYFSNGGMINLDTNQITPEGGLKEKDAKGMGLKANLLTASTLKASGKIETDANTGGDPMTSLHMRNWMECIRSRKETNAPARVGFNHSVANIMATQALHTGKRVSWDPKKKDIVLS
ncbi:gfo/Idh/MocA family oxidoreductase [Dyadobacter luteus]|jgi:predicted dehydrogenase|uniref:Gfo/Idh/MocA family oxidoreductase n=1 Tax=Dyadobacter luteus TaxID=2259619 RepID=A0A3D8YGC2_9BACT|nr:Gfo/Idh/MocA family oxidoreductase [Dyadobacter luteus]REA63711.1 gfo/Idh/MocA family oxidoreductase [Dyadobacter luteus]